VCCSQAKLPQLQANAAFPSQKEQSCDVISKLRRYYRIQVGRRRGRALEHRVEMTNVDADEEEMVSFNDVVEWYLLSPLSVKEMPHLEDAVPGFTAALVRWMIESTYNGPE